MKYIDAEKLKVGIQQLIECCIRNEWDTTQYCLRKVLSIIDTLQQEQVSVEKQIAEDKNSIEYVRKDAFIDKMREFLGERYLIKTKEPLRWVSITKVINDFKKYMEE